MSLWKEAFFNHERETHFHSGGAAGFDTLVAVNLNPKALISAAHFKHTLHIPFSYQITALGVVGAHAEDFDLCRECGPKPQYVRATDNHLYQRRNEHMVDSADLLVAYYNGQAGGTKNCIEYAVKKGVRVVDVRRYDIGYPVLDVGYVHHGYSS